MAQNQDRTASPLFEAGSGISFLYTKLPPKIERRIEELGRLNDRRNKALANGDRDELRRIASEYAERRMYVMAQEVMKESELWQTKTNSR